jgi:hypothetical protein
MRWNFLLLLLGGSLLAVGCEKGAGASQPELAAQGAQFLLAEEPEGAVGILEHREALPTDEEEPQTREIVLWGRIGGKKQTWSDATAEFVLSDPTFALQAGDHVCKDDNCPFCKDKRNAASAEAIVSLVDGQGRVPAVGVRKLLPLEEGQMVVVQGQAEVNSLGLMLVRAKGIYVRQ